MSSQVLAKPSGSLHRLSLRLHVALHRPTLDAELARGADPVSDEALALRAERLGEPSTREALADTLQNLLDAAEEPPNTWHQGDPRPPLQRETVLAARGVLLALREALNRPGRVPPRAVALATQLAWDSASPVYAAASETSVAEFARTVLQLLNEDHSKRDAATRGH
jgi:hypothetical protein